MMTNDEKQRLTNDAIPLETQKRVFVVITNRQLDLPVDTETLGTNVEKFNLLDFANKTQSIR